MYSKHLPKVDYQSLSNADHTLSGLGIKHVCSRANNFFDTV